MYKVMIVDDEPWSRKVIKQLIEWDKLQLEHVGEAEDGTQGLRLVEELKPDILITDMRMPGIDGIELLRALNERYPSLKIIVMSGYDDFVYLKQAIRSKVTEYLLKPVDPDELNTALTQCMLELQETKHNSMMSLKTSLTFTNGLMYNEVIDSLKKSQESKNKLDIGEVLTYINQHYVESITLDSIAIYFHISKEHLSRAFKTFSGDTITDHINRIRMEKAKELIVEHKLAIKHVAELTGYTDVAYFYRVFKKHYGLAPGELRKEKNNNNDNATSI